MDEYRPLLPGYVFMRGQVQENELFRVHHVIRLLRYADGTAELRGNDLTFARTVFEEEGVIPKLQAVQEGDFVKITYPLLQNLSGRVVRVDRRKRLAKVEVMITGSARMLWLGLEILQSE